MQQVEDGESRWAAVVKRTDPAEGMFYYGVMTTGVFCRPSCGARRPRRENVRFFSTVDRALGAGFRPCKRCTPTQQSPRARQAEKVAQICALIAQQAEAPQLAALAAAVGWSPGHTRRVFQQMVGVTPKAYAQALRRERLHLALATAPTVTDAMFRAGYRSSGRFYEESQERLGMKPSTFQQQAHGQTIRFAVGECSLGSVLVASTEIGVCAVLLGDAPEPLLADLQRRFNQARFIGGDAAYETTVAHVVGLIEDPGLERQLPLDVQGTAFQQRVWQALLKIPAGKTASYSEIAAAIGAPRSARAVAQACGANPVAVMIPCHRVVRRDGGLSGYRWGIERKRRLLERESALTGPG